MVGVGAGIPRSLGIRREQRLRKKADFARIYSRGRSWANRLLVLRVLPNALEINRLGFVVSRRVGKAVVRNKVRRRIREAVRVLELEPCVDLVFIARAAVATADYHSIKMAAEELLNRAGMLRH